MMINSFIPIWLMVIICVAIIALKRKGKWAFIRQVIIAVLVFCINLRIMIPSDNVNKKVTNLDILFVVDTTISMVAEDYNGENTRFSAVKNDMKEIADAFPSSRVSILTFDDVATRILPYEEFHESVNSTIDSMTTRKYTLANGSTLNTAFKEMKSALERDENYVGEPAYRVVFFISDGEITDDREPLSDFSELADSIECGAVLGYGTADGGKMKVTNFLEEEEYLTTYVSGRGEEYAISKIDEDNLEQVASDLKLDYYHMTKKSDVDEVIDNISTSIDNGDIEMKDAVGFGYVETYYYFAIALGAFLVYDAVFYRRKLKDNL